MSRPMTCDQLVALVRANGEQALDGMDWLDELTDVQGVADFTGLSVLTIRSYHGKSTQQYRPGSPRWSWPKPDMTLSGRPGWKLRTVVLARASMPGRGAGGGRPAWRSNRASQPSVEPMSDVQADEALTALLARWRSDGREHFTAADLDEFRVSAGRSRPWLYDALSGLAELGVIRRDPSGMMWFPGAA